MSLTAICCVVVTFNPDNAELQRVIEGILCWAQKVILVDNTPRKNIDIGILKNYPLDIIQVGENIGIGAAQNIGILQAINLGFEWIVLSDQDTFYPENYGARMRKALEIHKNACAIFPTFIDSHRLNKDSIKATVPTWYGWKKVYPPAGIFDLYEGAASGMMLKSSCIKNIGLMNENLFMDWVDFEWCWRARAAGFRVLGTSEVKVIHSLGIGIISFGKKIINIRPPSRHYYIVRNCIYLAINSNSLTPLVRCRLLFKSLTLFFGYSLLLSPRLENLGAVFKGLRDGLSGSLGRRF